MSVSFDVRIILPVHSRTSERDTSVGTDPHITHVFVEHISHRLINFSHFSYVKCGWGRHDGRWYSTSMRTSTRYVSLKTHGSSTKTNFSVSTPLESSYDTFRWM